jgi:hypothetical protein
MSPVANGAAANPAGTCGGARHGLGYPRNCRGRVRFGQILGRDRELLAYGFRRQRRAGEQDKGEKGDLASHNKPFVNASFTGAGVSQKVKRSNRRSAMRHLRILALVCAALAATPAFASEEGGKEGGAKHKVTQSESWVSLEPMYATIIDADRPCGMLMVEIGLDIPDEKLRANATAALPLLRDYYLRSLTSFTASTVRPWHQPDVSVIADRLQRVTDRALKKKGAKVLMAQLAMRITK